MVSGGLFNGNFCSAFRRIYFQICSPLQKTFFTPYQQGKMEQNLSVSGLYFFNHLRICTSGQLCKRLVEILRPFSFHCGFSVIGRAYFKLHSRKAEYFLQYALSCIMESSVRNFYSLHHVAFYVSFC